MRGFVRNNIQDGREAGGGGGIIGVSRRETVLEGGGEGKEGWCPRPLGLGPLPMNGTFPRVGGHGLEAPRCSGGNHFHLLN